jgi:capsular polysaccharide biosynthesis protein
MQNEELLIDRLTKLGVDIFEPERHDAREQVKAFSSAEMVIGPSGAAMFNTIFCRPGTKVIDIESEPHWLWAHTGLFASCELRYGIFLGKPDPADTRSVHRRWNVDIDALVERVEDFWRA